MKLTTIALTTALALSSTFALAQSGGGSSAGGSTAGGAGIGRAIALTLASAGVNIVIAELIPERCEAVAAEVRALGVKAIAPRTDSICAIIDSSMPWTPATCPIGLYSAMSNG